MYIYDGIKLFTLHGTAERCYKKYWKRHSSEYVPNTHAHKYTSWKGGAHPTFTSHLFTSPMATLHVASTGADRCLEKQGWKTPRLPEIVHPLQRVEDR